jgi:protocatechuate 3,4-dioxygenase beta subunit
MMSREFSMKQRVAGLILCGFISAFGCRSAGSEPVREPVVGLPCEGCEAVFEGIPDSLEWQARIAPEGEPGVPFRIVGTVRTAAGAAAGNVIVYAYHTDAGGIYPRGSELDNDVTHRHGRLRAWVRTGEDGRYRFDTIRPSGYPNSDIPAHVHMHVIEPGRCTYYIDDILFEDDPRLDPATRKRMYRGRGGGGIAQPTRDESGRWLVRRDIVLGENIPGYPELPSPDRSKPR